MITVGIDEVGRGCWAGPLVAGAVILDKEIAGLRDSKKLSRLQREKLHSVILTDALAVGLGWVMPKEVDSLGLTSATRLAMKRALACIDIEYDEIIIDGNLNFFPDDIRSRAVIKADDSVASVSAASIVAKVERDNWMCTEAAFKFPQYHFDKHVGYGTELHKAMLKLYGVTELHRLSYRPIQSLMISNGQ